MKFRQLTKLCLAFLALVLASAASVTLDSRVPRYDMVIINARLVDGSGNPQFRTEIGIKNGRIVAIGELKRDEASRIIDAKDQIVAPGFIDLHTHVESVYEYPAAENFIRMGVTSLVTGNCGSSAPDIAKFLDEKTNPALAVNLGTLIGHNSVRARVMGSEQRDPTAAELRQMEQLVEQGMKDGALGLSTGLIYVPGTYAKLDEIARLAQVAAKYDGIYATHIRNEGDGVVEAIKEAITVGEQAKLPVEISHFKITSKKLWGHHEEVLDLVRSARNRGLSVHVDQYAYTASSTSLDVLLPDWVRAGGREASKVQLADASTRQRVAGEMKATLSRNGYDDYAYAVILNYAADPSLNGKSIAALAKERRRQAGLDEQIEAIFEIYSNGGASMIYHKMSEDDVRRIMIEPFTIIASDSGVRTTGENFSHPRSFGNTSRVLGYYTRDLQLLTVEGAVRKMTSLPAQVLGLTDRGLVRKGFAADLVIFDDAKVSGSASFEQAPQYAEGITCVMVNGKIVLKDGQRTAERPGSFLRRRPSSQRSNLLAKTLPVLRLFWGA